MLRIIETQMQDGKPIKEFVLDRMLPESVYTMPEIDANVIYSVCYYTPGPHIEIGVLDGGSAIVAGIAKSLRKKGEIVYGVDKKLRKNTLRNIELLGLNDTVMIYEQEHPPLPDELENITFGSAFIDGAHGYEPAMADWMNLKDRVAQYIIFHDVQHTKFGCRRVFYEACDDPDWTGLFMIGKVGVLERVSG